MNGLYGAFEIISKAIILSLWTTEKGHLFEKTIGVDVSCLSLKVVSS